MWVKQTVLNHLKNVLGWRTDRKFVIIVVDDYGNVRLRSKVAREQLNKLGYKLSSRFDAFDTLETRDDLEALFDTLYSARDKNGSPAIFSPYALSCNPDFETMSEQGNIEYIPELLTETYQKLSIQDSNAYMGTWNLWKEGIEKGLMAPQYHGREHLNIRIFNDLLKKRDPLLLSCIANKSIVGLDDSSYPNMGWTKAFSFSSDLDYSLLLEIFKEGIYAFEQVYGYQPVSFTPPARDFPIELEKYLHAFGISIIDRALLDKRHLGNGKYKLYLSTTKEVSLNAIHMVRNVVFEPTFSNIDHVAKAMNQIAAAFFWRKPAIISSHRVNFCGHIDQENRKKGLNDLRRLLNSIIQKWPDAEFISVSQLGKLMKLKIQE